MNSTQRRLISDGYAKVKEAAKFLGCSETRVYELIYAGVLSNARHGNRRVIPWAALHKYAAERLNVGSVA
jgi:excisionase family DNA binding protein